MAELVKCSICGRMMTRNGLVGHMSWKHNPMAQLSEDVTAQLAEKVAFIAESEKQLMDTKAAYEKLFFEKNNLGAQLSEKDAQVAELEARLSQATAEPSDQERFNGLVDDITVLTPEGKARLAEETGWKLPGLEPVAQARPALLAETDVRTEVKKPRRYVFVVRR